MVYAGGYGVVLLRSAKLASLSYIPEDDNIARKFVLIQLIQIVINAVPGISTVDIEGKRIEYEAFSRDVLASTADIAILNTLRKLQNATVVA